MKAKKLGYRVTKKESAWNIVNSNEKDKYFMRRYVLDIKKALYHMEGIDRSMLNEWYLNKHDEVFFCLFQIWLAPMVYYCHNNN